MKNKSKNTCFSKELSKKDRSFTYQLAKSGIYYGSDGSALKGKSNIVNGGQITITIVIKKKKSEPDYFLGSVGFGFSVGFAFSVGFL